jgi:cytochrome bd-type quinol oxidase subunit 2
VEVLWFSIAAFALVIFVVLDSGDLGAGIVQLFVCRSEVERRPIAASVKRFWDGNESWLLVSIFAVNCAERFPVNFQLNGFYPSFALGLALLLLRGYVSVHRNDFESNRLRQLIDAGTAATGAVLAVAFGGVLGNLIRGYAATYLDAFAVLCGITALVVVSLQGILWMMLRAMGDFRRRCRRYAAKLWWGTAFCCLGVTVAEFAVQPRILENLQRHSWISGFAILAMAGLIGIRLCLGVDFELGAFASAACLIAGLLACAAFGQLSYLPAKQPHGFDFRLLAGISALGLAVGYNFFGRRLVRAR